MSSKSKLQTLKVLAIITMILTALPALSQDEAMGNGDYEGPSLSGEYVIENSAPAHILVETSGDTDAAVESGGGLDHPSLVLNEDIPVARPDEVLSGVEYRDPMFQDIDIMSALSFGERADTNLIADENENGIARNAAITSGNEEFLAMPQMALGYMHDGMNGHIGSPIVADANIAQLYQRHASLRSQANITLPADFNPLVAFILGYIRENSLENAERDNGITHLTLARQIVKASFCFGNDPLMVVSKIRRETNFNRKGVSSGGAVGFSQMTGAGIREVQHQMSGNTEISVENARSSFRRAISCFIGRSVYTYATGSRETVQTHLQRNYVLDLIFGQILMKTYVSYARSTRSSATEAYREAFVLYNGDTSTVTGRCLRGRVQMKNEYACDVMAHYRRLNSGWSQYRLKSPRANTRYAALRCESRRFI